MIGRFFYAERKLSGCIVVEMEWKGESAQGVMHIPEHVSKMTEGTDYGLIRTGETLALPIALGLGVILASLTFTDFYLSGDQTAWSEQWGPLETLEPGTEGFPFGA